MQPEQLPYRDNRLDLDPHLRDRRGVPVVRCTFDFAASDRRLFAFLRERAAEWLTEAGASETWSSEPTPAAISTHAYGGTRMGDDPRTSVVDRWGMLHGVANVGVLGASCFPTTGGRGPTQTVEALAWRTAEHLVMNWDAFA